MDASQRQVAQNMVVEVGYNASIGTIEFQDVHVPAVEGVREQWLVEDRWWTGQSLIENAFRDAATRP